MRRIKKIDRRISEPARHLRFTAHRFAAGAYRGERDDTVKPFALSIRFGKDADHD